MKQINKYIEWLQRKNFSPETIKKYSRILNSYGNKKINTDTITNFLFENLNKCEPATLRSKRNALASYSKFLKVHATIEWENISKIIPQVQKRLFPTLNYEDLKKLKSVRTQIKTNERDSLILDFLYYTGIRVNELINIRHCDYQNQLLRIAGKGNKIRYIPLPPFLAQHFKTYPQSYLFLTRSGKKLTKGQIRRFIIKRVSKTDISKNISPHSFRRSLATNLYNLEGKLATIHK